MAENRTLTVSVTINLGNEENLKLEVTDTAETVEEAANLRKFLAEVLDGYGKNNAATRSAIESYKERLLLDTSTTEEPVIEEVGETPFIPVMPIPDDEPAFEPLPEVETTPEKPVIPMFMDVPADSESSSSVGPLFEPVEKEKDYYPPVMPSPAPIHEPEEPSIEYVCSKCGAPVTKSQHDFSMLFNHKILCRNCMK